MISKRSIIDAVSHKVREAIVNIGFEADIYPNKSQLEEYMNPNETCIYIEVFNIDSTVATYETDLRTMVIFINCYPRYNEDPRRLYDLEDAIEERFLRTLKVDDYVLDIDGVTVSRLEDEVGSYISIGIEVSYFDDLINFEENDLMDKILLNYHDNINIEGEV